MPSPRRYSESSDDENPKKRRKISDKIEIEERLESLISRVGDKSTSSSLESNLEALASVLEADLGNHKNKIFKIILTCAIDLPQRMNVYSTIVGLLNVSNYTAGGDFVDMLIMYFKDSLMENNYSTAVHLMRFLSDLVNCKVVMPSSVLDFYKIFLDAAFEENTPQIRSDWLVYAVLSCLPWSGKELSEKREVELDRMLSSVEGYMERRNGDFIPALLVWNGEEQRAKDKLSNLWVQLHDMRQSNWREKMLRRPYEAFESTFRDAHALQHTIPSITLPPYDKNLTPFPEIVFRIFDYTDIIEDAPRLPKEHSVDRFIVEETIQAIIHANCLERKVCADLLLSIEFKEKVPLNYLIIEAIFGQLFTVPDSPSIHLMYGVLLIELCKLQPSYMPQVLAQATMILYNKLDTMNSTCVQRFSEWFSYHLSNFQFKWMWEDWIDCLDLHPESPKSKFVRETLKKCLRLSYYQRVVDIVPATFASLLPPEPLPVNKFDAEENVTGREHVEKVVDAIKRKSSVEEINSVLASIKDDASVESGHIPLKMDVFLTSLLFLASKTPSHSFAAVAKYHATLKALTEGHTKQECQHFQICLLNSLYNLWINKPQMVLILVDKFLKTQLVSCSAVIIWVFSDRMAPAITSFHMHELLESTLKKLQLQVENERKQMEKNLSKKKIEEDEEDDEMSTGAEPETSVNLEKFTKEYEGLQVLILEKLISIMMDHINSCDVQGRPYKTYKFEYLKDRLKEFLLKSRSARILNELKSKYYETNLHLSILEIFEMVQPLLL